MLSSKLIRWGGSAAIGTALLGIVNMLLLVRYGEPPGPRLALYAYELSWGGSAALLAVYALAIRRLHVQNGRDFGRLGKTAVFFVLLSGVLFSVKTLIVLAGLVIGAKIPYVIMSVFMVPGTVGALLGPVLLGIAILRAKVMPGWFGWLQTLSVPLFLATNGMGYGGFVGGLIMIILGAALLKGWRARIVESMASSA